MCTQEGSKRSRHASEVSTWEQSSLQQHFASVRPGNHLEDEVRLELWFECISFRGQGRGELREVPTACATARRCECQAVI